MTDQAGQHDEERGDAPAPFKLSPEQLQALRPLLAPWWTFWETAMTRRARERGDTSRLVFGIVKLRNPPAADRHRLGLALTQWAVDCRPQCGYAVEPLGTSDLLAEELPKPWSIRLAHYTRGGWGALEELRRLCDTIIDYDGPRPPLNELAAELLKVACETNPGGMGDHRDIPIAAIGPPTFALWQIAKSLRRAIPAEAVADVIIGPEGRSWRDY
jgi:hypothetical protein